MLPIRSRDVSSVELLGCCIRQDWTPFSKQIHAAYLQSGHQLVLRAWSCLGLAVASAELALCLRPINF